MLYKIKNIYSEWIDKVSWYWLVTIKWNIQEGNGIESWWLYLNVFFSFIEILLTISSTVSNICTNIWSMMTNDEENILLDSFNSVSIMIPMKTMANNFDMALIREFSVLFSGKHFFCSWRIHWWVH